MSLLNVRVKYYLYIKLFVVELYIELKLCKNFLIFQLKLVAILSEMVLRSQRYR